LIGNTNCNALENSLGWVDSQRYDNSLWPSEKQYQIEWWAILMELTSLKSEIYSVGFETRAGAGRVDLALLRKLDKHVCKYQIELGANLPNTGKFSIESHYLRQLDNYHDNETRKSMVVIILNNPKVKTLYAPTRNHDANIQLVIV